MTVIFGGGNIGRLQNMDHDFRKGLHSSGHFIGSTDPNYLNQQCTFVPTVADMPLFGQHRTDLFNTWGVCNACRGSRAEIHTNNGVDLTIHPCSHCCAPGSLSERTGHKGEMFYERLELITPEQQQRELNKK